MYAVTREKEVIESMEVVVYGIRYADTYTVHNVSTDKSAVENLVNDFNKYNLDPIHLYDAVEDFLEQ
ncbi:MAG: hypothetical protein J1F01_00020 [Oscillospiraceae bacterium]|nr:hypothetical protein [Oscillospiraceae bacterium]